MEKFLSSLSFDKKLVKEIRAESGACNQKLLTRIAVAEFLKRHSKPNGQPDIKGIAQIVGNQRAKYVLPKQIERAKKKVAELEGELKKVG